MAIKPDHIYGDLPNEWLSSSIAELIENHDIDIQTGPFGTMLHASEYVQHGIPVVAVKNIGMNAIVNSDIPKVSLETSERLAKYKLYRGDILFGRKGAVERRALIRDFEEGWIQGSDCIRLRVSTKLCAAYLSYVFGTPQHLDWITRNAQGATMPSLNQEIIGRIPVPLPPLPEQRAIAHILGTLDDKIELNRKMNETLEAIARTVFKSWFVDFDPVRAKIEGRQPAGIDAETAALFPDGFQESALGMIPRGWKVGRIGDVVQTVGGATPSTKEESYWENGTFPFATPKDLSSISASVLLNTERKLTDLGVKKISSGLLPRGSVLLSSRAPIGYLAITEISVCINQGFIAMICDKDLPNHYVLRWAEFNLPAIIGNANGTTFLEISKKNFRPMTILVPPISISERFKSISDEIHAKIVLDLKESQTLASLRDTLLPKLISGEIRIKDAEKFLEKTL